MRIDALGAAEGLTPCPYWPAIDAGLRDLTGSILAPPAGTCRSAVAARPPAALGEALRLKLPPPAAGEREQ